MTEYRLFTKKACLVVFLVNQLIEDCIVITGFLKGLGHAIYYPAF